MLFQSYFLQKEKWNRWKFKLNALIEINLVQIGLSALPLLGYRLYMIMEDMNILINGLHFTMKLPVMTHRLFFLLLILIFSLRDLFYYLAML